MYPIEGNEAAVGLDYRTAPTQFEAADRARRTRELVLAGPLELKQGGIGLITRIPVFLQREETGEEYFWGLISAVIDVNRFFLKRAVYWMNRCRFSWPFAAQTVWDERAMSFLVSPLCSMAKA
jgi:sensor domain CHASE-containing protein